MERLYIGQISWRKWMVLFRLLAQLPWEIRIYWVTLQRNTVKFPWVKPLSKWGQFFSSSLCCSHRVSSTRACCSAQQHKHPCAEAVGSWTCYFRNLISIGLWDMTLKISVVAGMKSPNSGQPKGVSTGKDALQNCSRAGKGAWELCLAASALWELNRGRAALKFHEDNNWVISDVSSLVIKWTLAARKNQVSCLNSKSFF